MFYSTRYVTVVRLNCFVDPGNKCCTFWRCTFYSPW